MENIANYWQENLIDADHSPQNSLPAKKNNGRERENSLSHTPFRVTTLAGLPPCHDASVLQKCCKRTVSGVDLFHLLVAGQFLLHCAGVAPFFGIAPCHDTSTLQNCCESPPIESAANAVRVEKISLTCESPLNFSCTVLESPPFLG